MQRATAASAGRWAGALGTGLALPLSFVVHAASFDDVRARVRPVEASAIAAVADASALARWHDYALSSITPQFSWAVLPPSSDAPRVLDNYTGTIERAPLFETRIGASTTHVGIAVTTGTVADTPSVLPTQATHLVPMPQTGLQRTVVTPSLAGDWGSRGSVRLTGVFAYQRFASFGLGTAMSDGGAPLPGWLGDSSYGAGARVDVSNVLGDHLRWNLGYQSRVGMGTYANYRGVFADAGHFDIPASASASLSYALTPHFGVDVGMQRVMYSAITPFASSNLPTRFLALLGDGSSPVFAWRDLNVYSVGGTWSDQDFGSVQLRYTTRQQPVPTSKLLENALADATANDMVTLGWSRGLGASSNLSFAASYATSPYYLLMPSYLSRANGTASQFEFEALWSVRF